MHQPETRNLKQRYRISNPIAPPFLTLVITSYIPRKSLLSRSLPIFIQSNELNEADPLKTKTAFNSKFPAEKEAIR